MMTSYYSKHANLLQKYQMRLSQQIFPGKEEKKENNKKISRNA
jgi:hypothetical protein